MRILLVNSNRERTPQPVVPLGVCLVASSLEARGFPTRLLDLHFSRSPRRDIARAVRKWKPDVVGLSLRNLDNGDQSQPRCYLPQVAGLVTALRECTNACIVIGGPAVSIAPASLLRRLAADYAVIGEGEQAMPELVSRLASDRPASDIPGVLSGESARAGPPTPARVANMHALPPPRLDRWLDLGRYLRRGSPLPVQTKRGCALRCIYCTYGLIEGSDYRMQPPEAVAAELEEAERTWNAASFEIVDAQFSDPPGHSCAVCEAIARRKFRARLHTMGLNPGSTSLELLRLMRRAGFRSAVSAPDSGSERMLTSLRKGFGLEDVARTATWANLVGLPVLWSLTFGGPGETKRTVQETLRFIETALGREDRILCTLGLRIYPGTELARVALEEQMIAPDRDLAEPAFYFSRHITPTHTARLIESSPVAAQVLYLSALQRPAVALALRARAALGLSGAPWREIPLYNRLLRLAGRGRRSSPRGVP